MDLHEEIALEAYILYERSGNVESRDQENWFEAERLVMARHKADQEQSAPENVEKVAESEREEK